MQYQSLKVVFPLLLFIALSCLSLQDAKADLADFEDVSAGSLSEGEVVTSGGLEFTIGTGAFSSASIGEGFPSNVGSGNRLLLNNRTTFSIVAPLSSLSFDYGHGNTARFDMLNGQSFTDSLDDLDGVNSLGVSFALTNVGSGGQNGTLTLTGPISSAQFLGTEAAFDNFNFVEAVPEPTSAGMALFASAVLATRRRRREVTR